MFVDLIGIQSRGKRIRILYLDVNLVYINPTRNLFPAVLKSMCDVVFYGPGYSDAENLRKGLDCFVRLNGPFDVVIASEHIVFSSLLERGSLLKSYKCSYVKQFDLKDTVYAREINDAFIKMPDVKCISLFESDYYNFPASQIDVIEESCSYVLGWGEQFVRPVCELVGSRKETFALHANDNWYNYTLKNRHKIISLPAFVSATEFSWVPIWHRSEAWSVVGARYWARDEARRVLNASGIRCGGKRLTLAMTLLSSLGVRPLANQFCMGTLNHIFRRTIESSRYSFTCGSGLGYPVRKYFEIPALGSVLVCVPCNGFEALGFKNGINAVSCLPEELPAIHRELEDNSERAQEIASAGREYVWQKHSIMSRSRQIYESLVAVMCGSFQGSFWEDGEYYVRKQNPDGSVNNVKVDCSPVNTPVCPVVN